MLGVFSSSTMPATTREVTETHSRLLRCSLCVQESRAYWAHADPGDPVGSSARAFEESWFGAKSEPWTAELLKNMQARFAAFPSALRVLGAWSDMAPDTRNLICHWHLQLTDPLYRQFTGEYLPERVRASRGDLNRHGVVQWVAAHGPRRWTLKTQIQFASRLLSCALAAGLLRGSRDPRQIVAPRVPDEALTYLFYLLRGLEFRGTLVDNPYLASVQMEGSYLAERLRTLPGLEYRRAGDVFDLEWRHHDLEDWAQSAREARA